MEEVKRSLFLDDMILYIENTKDAIKKYSNKQIKQLQDIKPILKYLLHLYTLIINH